MLVTLRLRRASRPDFDLAVDSPGEDADPWVVLRAHADTAGRIRVSDHESCRLEEIVYAEFVATRRAEGPEFEHGLQDEDVAAALDENYERPR
jgi:hypothetical protein